jgi:hypothetical protein
MLNLLQMQAAGKGPSLGRGMMQQGLQQAIKNQRAQAAGMMGTNPALAQKLSGQQAGAMTAQSMRDVGQVGLQEQMGAQQALQAWLQQERAAQMAYEQQRLMQEGMYQQRLMGWDPATSGIFGDIAGVAGDIFGFGAGAGWFGGNQGRGQGQQPSPYNQSWGY